MTDRANIDPKGARLHDKQRRQLIEELLDHLPDYEPAKAAGQGSGDGSPPRMPAIFWEREVQALFDALERLRVEPALMLPSGREQTGRTVHAHLIAFYHSPRRTVRPDKRRRVIRGVVHHVESPFREWKLERVVSSWVILPLKEIGVDFVVKNYRGEPASLHAICDRLDRKEKARAA